MNKLETAQQLLVDLRQIMATATTMRNDLKEAGRNDTASFADHHTNMVLGIVLRCNEAKSPEKLAACKRNIIAAENALKQASVDQNGVAYNSALFVLKCFTDARDREMA